MRRAIGFMLCVLVACGSDGIDLRVDVRTDWLPGIEFSSVRTTGLDGSPVRAETSASASDDFLAGERVAAIEGLDPQVLFMTVELLDEAGTLVAARPVQIDLRGDLAVTVVITRDCSDVSCAGAMSACQNRACIDPRCTDEALDFCPEGCETDTECPSTGLACVDSVCVAGACYLVPNHDRCASAMCSITEGCTGEDAGVDASFDAGIDAPPPDAFTYEWVEGGFGGCSRGFRTQSVTCVRSDGMTVDDMLCSVDDRPDSSRGCAWTQDYGMGNVTTTRRPSLEPADNGNCAPGCAPPCTGSTKPASECRELCLDLADDRGERYVCVLTACTRSCRVFDWQTQGSLNPGNGVVFAGYPPGDRGP